MNKITTLACLGLGLILLTGCSNPNPMTPLSSGELTTWAIATGTEIMPTGSVAPQFTTSMSWALTTMVTLSTPIENTVISNPLLLTGTAPGNWFFEATAPVSIVNWDGLIIGEWYISALDDWMTTGLVLFSGSVSFERDPMTPYPHGRLILKRSNPSWESVNDQWIEIPILFE